MRWHLSWRADPAANRLAKRHYTCQSRDSDQFVPPGRCLVLYLKTEAGEATWVTSWPFAEHTKHAWAGAWVCSIFRNEGAGVSSELIREAVAATRWKWPEIPAIGMVTMVDPAKTAAGRSAWAKPGRCYRKAGFREVGRTKEENLVVLALPPEAMPQAEAPIGAQGMLF